MVSGGTVSVIDTYSRAIVTNSGNVILCGGKVEATRSIATDGIVFVGFGATITGDIWAGNANGIIIRRTDSATTYQL
ncbi:MAG: hypothetical protein FWH20_07415, partial [Oscillospiraceae bacterium]|nr:hypothetical protein [Oscillospiraceae bacterium]